MVWISVLQKILMYFLNSLVLSGLIELWEYSQVSIKRASLFDRDLRNMDVYYLPVQSISKHFVSGSNLFCFPLQVGEVLYSHG